ncbi:signal peptidase I [Bacillus piscicola]|uniref:signal peptidase I n=1 Tax=Bacillus piscicola TaxID=1632684 RepID=UPI001F08D6B1|nr:signal peptidase I [Bacillus piscicola]
MKHLKNWLPVFSLFIFLYAMFFFVSHIQHPERLPKMFGFQVVKVLSGSMEPTFSKGDLLFLKETGVIKTGSIIMFAAENGALVTHRVSSMAETGFYTKGDANPIQDAHIVTFDAVVGIYAFHLPFAGDVVHWLASKYGIVSSAGVLLLIFLSSYYEKTIKKLCLRKKYVRYMPTEVDKRD